MNAEQWQEIRAKLIARIEAIDRLVAAGSALPSDVIRGCVHTDGLLLQHDAQRIVDLTRPRTYAGIIPG